MWGMWAITSPSTLGKTPSIPESNVPQISPSWDFGEAWLEYTHSGGDCFFGYHAGSGEVCAEEVWDGMVFYVNGEFLYCNSNTVLLFQRQRNVSMPIASQCQSRHLCSSTKVSEITFTRNTYLSCESFSITSVVGSIRCCLISLSCLLLLHAFLFLHWFSLSPWANLTK